MTFKPVASSLAESHRQLILYQERWALHLKHEPRAWMREKEQYASLLKAGLYEEFFSLLSDNPVLFAPFLYQNRHGNWMLRLEEPLSPQMRLLCGRALLQQQLSRCEPLSSLIDSGLLDSFLFRCFSNAMQIGAGERESLLRCLMRESWVPQGRYQVERGAQTYSVHVPRNLWVSRYPVTELLWHTVMGETPSPISLLPVSKVSWPAAKRFALRLSEKRGLEKAYAGRGRNCRISLDAKGYRLPTEAEWEHIALGGARHIYAGSNSLEDVGWYWGNSYLSPKRVAQKSPNPFGIYDLSGNVSEWCLDSWAEGEHDSTVLKVEDPFFNDPEENRRVSKGGHWHMTDYGCQIRYREASSQYSPNKYQGFRLVRCA